MSNSRYSVSWKNCKTKQKEKNKQTKNSFHINQTQLNRQQNNKKNDEDYEIWNINSHMWSNKTNYDPSLRSFVPLCFLHVSNAV